MAQYNTLNVTLSNSQLNKLKSGIISTETILVVVDDCNYEKNFPHKLLLTNTQYL